MRLRVGSKVPCPLCKGQGHRTYYHPDGDNVMPYEHLCEQCEGRGRVPLRPVYTRDERENLALHNSMKELLHSEQRKDRVR